MRWILLDLAVALGALAVLALLVLRLWRSVQALSAAVRTAGDRIGSATDALAAAQLDGPLGGPAGGHGPAAAPPGSARDRPEIRG